MTDHGQKPRIERHEDGSVTAHMRYSSITYPPMKLKAPAVKDPLKHLDNMIYWAVIAALILWALAGCGQHVDRPYEHHGSAAIQHQGGPMVLLSSVYEDSRGNYYCKGSGC